MFEESMNELKVTKESANKLLVEITKPNEDILEDIAVIHNTIKEIENISISNNYTLEDIRNDISKISVYSKDDIRIDYKIIDKVKQLLEKHRDNIDEYLMKVSDEPM
jgi:hypothetical protein